MAFGRRLEVFVGQVYRKTDSTRYVFEVMSVKSDPQGSTHVQLFRRDEPSTRRTLASSVLLDPNEFELLQDVPHKEDNGQ